MNEIKGIGVSEGIGFGKSLIYVKEEIILEKGKSKDQILQLNKYNEALKTTEKELKHLISHTNETMSQDESAIFQAHLMILDDPEIKENIEKEIANNEYALNAIHKIYSSYIDMFSQMDNDYMNERALDLKDIMTKLIYAVNGKKTIDLSKICKDTIIISEDLLPSEIAKLNKKYIKGIVTEKGGKTSHTAIMARTLEIPALVINNISKLVKDNTDLIIDGNKGVLISNPSNKQVLYYKNTKTKELEFKTKILTLKNERSKTKDNKYIHIASNIGTEKDLKHALEVGAEGIGLFRTEFLFMDRKKAPSEEEQFEVYKKILSSFPNHKVVIRTLDIGGDKKIPYMDFPNELNPFLGFRAIRYCLENDDVLRTQLRALIRASYFGNLSIMFPMISMIEEIRKVKEIYNEEKEKLQKKSEKISNKIEIGMMIEVPSAAIMANDFAKEVDFFSIGTNDLTQYVTASDRMNPKLINIYTPLQPAVINLIANVIKAGKNNDIWVGMCGEAGANSLLLPLWISMGIDELSMSSSSILKARFTMKQIDSSKLKKWKEKVLLSKTLDQVKDSLKVHSYEN